MKLPQALSPLLLGIVCLGGCSHWNKPRPETLANVPTFKFGENTPASGDFVLYFPAGKPIPLVTTIEGSALAQGDSKKLTVTLKKDIYAYKEWMSFDRKTWVRGDEALDFQVEIRAPSPQFPGPGYMNLKVDLK